MFFVFIKVEHIYYAPFSELFTELNFYTICAIFGVVLIIMGFLFDLVYVVVSNGNEALMCNTKKTTSISKEQNGYQNEACEQADEARKKEFAELMKEVTQIKEDVNKLSECLVTPHISENNNFIIQAQSISY